MAVDTAVSPESAPVRRRLTGIVAGLTAAKILASASGFITGPLLARALGAAGRGDLAAVQVPLAIAPAIVGLGIPIFAFRELPKGRAPAELFGSLAVPLLLIGLLTMGAAVPVADALAGTRETVRTYLIVCFMTMPVLLVGALFTDCLVALERWRAVTATIIIPYAVAFVGTVILYVLGDLTLGWACALTITGSLLGLIPAIPMLMSSGRPAFSLSLARQAISFGVKSWVGGLALLANLRLDQVLMIAVVTPRILGLYAVATTLSGASALATGALAQSLMARVGRNERYLIPRAVRVALAVTAVTNLLLALATPILLTGLFGSDFRAAVPMAYVLLIGAVPFGAGVVMSSALQADGAPIVPSIAEGIALIVTVLGLLLLLRPLGGIGAAIVSDVAYATSFAFQVAMAKRRLGVPAREFLVPTRADLRWAFSIVPRMTRRLGWAA